MGMENQTLLTTENYKRGFLVDEELMAGITEEPGQENSFIAYVLRHTTGEYLGYHAYATLDDALKALHVIQRNWIFEPIGKCGEGKCGKGGCGGSKCSTRHDRFSQPQN